MSVEYKIISIGALSKNKFWNENEPVRTAHATTTLIISNDKKILVDPSLPGKVLEARLYERAGLHIEDITTVFLTTFRATHRLSLTEFKHAEWLIYEREKEYATEYLEEMKHKSTDFPETDKAMIETELNIIRQCKQAPEKLTENVELFPSPGASAGSCGLLLTPPIGAIVVAGDAVINRDYLEHGQIWEHSFDLKSAQQSLEDIIEIADLIIPGHDNIIPLMGKLL